jgi:hypothetical protein
VRAYFAPVNRSSQVPVLFDPAVQGRFDLDLQPAPWMSLGWIQNFVRKAGSQSAPLMTGIPASPLTQVRESLQAEVSLEFLSWTKLTMALATGSQHMNVLNAASGAAPAADGARGSAAVTPQLGSTEKFIALESADLAGFAAGSMIAVDLDYSGQSGYVGSPVAGAYVRQSLSDVDYIRRVTFNVGLVAEVSAAGLLLATPLPGGAPAAGMKVQAIAGFVDREGGSFYQEWSALFAMEGAQGERIFFHYPRLQAISGAEEVVLPLDPKHKTGQSRVLLKGQFLALPVTDPLDGERVVCYRSFLPAAHAVI